MMEPTEGSLEGREASGAVDRQVNQDPGFPNCFTVAVFAAKEGDAENQVVSENPGYTVTPISFDEYINVDVTCGN